MMDTEYFKTLKYYVECLVSIEKIEPKHLELLVARCPEHFVNSFKTKDFNLDFIKNLPTIHVDGVAQTNLAIGVCYFLAKTDFLYSDLLIKPLLTYINTKIVPRVYFDPRNGSLHQEKYALERMNWASFTIIASTLISYTLKHECSDTDTELIIKSLTYYWLRIVKSITKQISQSSSNSSKVKDDGDKTPNKAAKKHFLYWYAMVFSSVSVGMYLRLDSQDLAKFILDSCHYLDYLHLTKNENIEIPEIMIKELPFN
ncbi:hypothetical protein RF11_07219 [Thelohanellus kitauei]|uniref:Uncharacterized protein n=1 Tax=Thelohanellus kitauei TaxID=669202 RepID=A0A0C2JVG8_THEKT|nr:hypothetical protein RF11_07219 [Thelohanellus kitauei]